jgi:hypothetical protein
VAPNAIIILIMAAGIIGGLGFGATMDLDNDGIANCEDPDDDADGLNDTLDEYPQDHDNDGIPDRMDDDDDNDGIPDSEDDYYVGNNSKPQRIFSDLDSDGIADCEDADDDGDGLNDTKDEYPHDHDNDGIPDEKDIDDDNDGINDTEDDEYVGNCSKPMHGFPHHGHGHGFDEFRRGCHGGPEGQMNIEDQETQGNQTISNSMYLQVRNRNF